jgi:cell wall-associated NlpC family hydrolase
MLPDWLAQYVGIPYATGGRDRAQGLDCWGLVCLVWRERFGLEEPPWAAPAWAGKADNLAVAGFIAQERERAYDPVEAGQERLGDAVLIRMRGHPLHVGLVVAPGRMLHTHERTMSCIDTYTGLEWSKRVLGFYRPHAHA